MIDIINARHHDLLFVSYLIKMESIYQSRLSQLFKSDTKYLDELKVMQNFAIY